MADYSKKRRASVSDVSGDSDNDASHKTVKKSKRSNAAISPAGKDDEGNPFWELSSKRRVGVSTFKNLCLINIREYYEKDGKTLPGKKGISLSLEQYTALLKVVPGINAKLREMGQLVDTADDVDDDASAIPKRSKKEKAKSERSNIDATSDEDED